MRYLHQLLCTAFLTLAFGQAHATSVGMDNYTDADMVKTVTGVWTFNQELSFTQQGKYEFSLTDLDFGAQFKYVGAMISTPDEKIASITIKNGVPSTMMPIEFEVGEKNYWVSIFAFTDSQANVGTLGFDIDFLGKVSEVPAPPALALMFTSLLGLVSFARYRRSQKSSFGALCFN